MGAIPSSFHSPSVGEARDDAREGLRPMLGNTLS